MDQARIRPTQVGASTAAAVGAAFLAARLGVYGTIIGVGVISLVTTVGGEMLLRSLERTKEAARTANLRPRTMAFAAPSAGAPHDPSDEADTIERPVPGAPPDTEAATVEPATAYPTHTLDMAATAEQQATDAADTVDMATTAEQPATTVLSEQPSSDDQPPRANRWTLITGGFAASFALALAVIAGIEVFTGQSLNGEDNPTVINVIRGNGQSTEDGPAVPTTPTDESTPTQEDESTSEPGDGAAPPGEPTAPAQSPAPDGDGVPSQRDEDATAPDEQQTPAPDEETPPPDDDESLPAEEQTTPPPDEEETPLPGTESTPAP